MPFLKHLFLSVHYTSYFCPHIKPIFENSGKKEYKIYRVQLYYYNDMKYEKFLDKNKGMYVPQLFSQYWDLHWLIQNFEVCEIWHLHW